MDISQQIEIEITAGPKYNFILQSKSPWHANIGIKFIHKPQILHKNTQEHLNEILLILLITQGNNSAYRH